MRKLLLFYLLAISIDSYSQTLDYHNSYESINICVAIQGNNFASERAADSALDDILNVIGASKRFVLQECSNINNAVALTMNGVRYIMYDPKFMISLSNGDEWSNKFILAHEVGHHINGHTVDVLAANSSNRVSLSTKRIQELEADEFAGFVLGRLGASLSDALSGVQSLSDKDDSYSTHPRRSKRITAIKKGFNESGGYVNPSNVSVKKGKTVDSPYSNSRFSGVEHVKKDYAGGVYIGYVGLKSREPFGYGEYRNKDGYTYEGEWSDGDYNGYGKQKWPDGNSYEGYFVSNIRSGEGVYTYPSGTKEIGLFANDDLTKGLRVFPNGDKVEGLWKNGAVIRCTVTENDGRITEFGFLDGSNGNGIGTFTLFSGGKIQATFENGGVKGSRGTLCFENGGFGGRFGSGNLYGKQRKVYKKARKNGLNYGVWSYIPDYIRGGLDIIFPDFFRGLDDKIAQKNDGKIIWNFTNMKGYKIKYNPENDFFYYYDNFKNYTYIGDLLGYGRINWTNRASYEGYFKWGTTKKAGYGEFIYGNDDERESYYGIWWDDKQNGYGVLTYKSGKIEKGVFRNNEFFKKEDFDLQLMQQLLKSF